MQREECSMREPVDEFVESVRDRGQWFDRGIRVEFFQDGSRHLVLEKAALGSYEVVDCTRVKDEDGAWLDVRLRQVVRATRGHKPRQGRPIAG
jgi:hypothetical protein